MHKKYKGNTAMLYIPQIKNNGMLTKYNKYILLYIH
jgi:hypothetical protein